MTELARTPPALRRLFQTVDLAPLPQSDVVADGVAIWKECRVGRVFPDFAQTIGKQTERVRDHALLASPLGRGEDFRIGSAGYRAGAALDLLPNQARLSRARARRLAARLRRLFQLVLEIGEPADVRFVEGERRFEVFAAPVCDERGALAVFCVTAYDDHSSP